MKEVDYEERARFPVGFEVVSTRIDGREIKFGLPTDNVNQLSTLQLIVDQVAEARNRKGAKNE